ncbi:hypothetical protein L249_6514 [Ophiocordyceps polyrhachis-furcata BCC 54312]|uniref:Uncharacterized protein n=1 Tax=Ophiocordyceps polyrhachis-furcata BCC 54312 TaxID=1330021 RepID=A0A367LKC2_9HYPO|nr:hypothetical protein L249_6514 [Ophiocordyceps polyrhachis-furcata BCC 54312]
MIIPLMSPGSESLDFFVYDIMGTMARDESLPSIDLGPASAGSDGWATSFSVDTTHRRFSRLSESIYQDAVFTLIPTITESNIIGPRLRFANALRLLTWLVSYLCSLLPLVVSSHAGRVDLGIIELLAALLAHSVFQ